MSTQPVPASYVYEADSGTTRAFGDTAVEIPIDPGGFTSGLLIIQVSGRTGDATVTPTIEQGAMVGASGVFAGASYTPPDGAIGAISANGVTISRIELLGVVNLTLTMGGTSGGLTTAIDLVEKHGRVGA